MWSETTIHLHLYWHFKKCLCLQKFTTKMYHPQVVKMEENPLYTILFKQHVEFPIPYGFLEMPHNFSCSIPLSPIIYSSINTSYVSGSAQ